jgi:hypothetical protein
MGWSLAVSTPEAADTADRRIQIISVREGV